MTWRRDVRLLLEYSPYLPLQLDMVAIVGAPAGLGVALATQHPGGLAAAVVCAVYLIGRVRSVRRLASRDFERGGTLLHAIAHVHYGSDGPRFALHAGQAIVIEIDGRSVDAVCRSGTVLVGRSGVVTVERADGEPWPPMARGDGFEFVAVSATVGGNLVADLLRDPSRSWLGGRD